MSILEILEAHTVKRPWSEASRMRCKCGETVTAETEGQLYALHRAHVAQVLEQHEREAKAEVWDEGAEAEASAACMNPPCGACDGCFTPVENPYKED